MKKSSITKIIISTILFVSFLIASLTLIIIAPKNEKINLTYEIIDEYEDPAESIHYYATYKITNNSYDTVEIDSIIFKCTEHTYYNDFTLQGYYSQDDVTIPANESFIYKAMFITSYELSDFFVEFEDAHFKNADPTLYIGIGLLLPMIISGYFFIVFMVKGIKEKNQLKNEK